MRSSLWSIAPDRVLCKQGHTPVMFKEKPRPAQAHRRKCRAPGGNSYKIVNPNFAEDPERELRQEFIADSSGLARVPVGGSLPSERFLLRSRAARWLPRDPPFAFLIDPSAQKVGSRNFALTEFSGVRIASVQHPWVYPAALGCLRVLFGAL